MMKPCLKILINSEIDPLRNLAADPREDSTST